MQGEEARRDRFGVRRRATQLGARFIEHPERAILEARRAAFRREKEVRDLGGGETLRGDRERAHCRTELAPDAIAGGGVHGATPIRDETPQVFGLAHHFESKTLGGGGRRIRSRVDVHAARTVREE